MNYWLIGGTFFFCIPLMVLLLWGTISPKTLWRYGSGFYKNPEAYLEANEPSDSSYRSSQICSLLMLIGLVITLVFLVAHETQSAKEQERRRQESQQFDKDMKTPEGRAKMLRDLRRRYKLLR